MKTSLSPWRPIGLAALFLLLGAIALAAERPRPNILVLFADDQRADTIGAHGNPHIRTPHIDSLVTGGFSFRRNYVFGGNSGAVCVPSRAMLMSGKTWFHIDTATLNGEKLMPELFGESGYATFGTGKWHNGQSSWLRAFQRGRSIMFGGMSDHTKVPIRDLQPDGTLSEQRFAEKFSSELFADAAVDFLRTHDRRKPFFAYVAFTSPHDPRQPPERYRDYYYKNRPPLPRNFQPQLPFDNGAMNGGRDENLAAWPRTEKVVSDQLAEYYGMVTEMDDQIGRILAALRESGQADNTVIVYAADNGLAMGSHGLLGKQSVFEHSVHTPLIFSGPGIPRGKSSQAFTYLYDIFPTLCDVLGVSAPAAMAGESLRPVWEGRKEKIRDTVFLPYIQVQRAVRDDRWKLIAYPKLGYLQLFDLQRDPDEQTNLVDRPGSAAEVTRLLGLMRQWQQRVGDTLEVPTTSKAPPKIDLTGKPRVPDQWQPDWIVDKYFDGVKAPPPGTKAGKKAK